MSLKNKLKLWFTAIVLFISLIVFAILNLEFIQKKVFDIKADLVGTDRTVIFYSKINGQIVKQYSDKDTRFQVEPNGAISVWLGKEKKKVFSNMDYIIEDN